MLPHIHIHSHKQDTHVTVVVCTNLRGKELHEQVGLRMVEPMWCNGSTLARNARDLGLNPTLGTILITILLQ